MEASVYGEEAIARIDTGALSTCVGYSWFCASDGRIGQGDGAARGADGKDIAVADSGGLRSSYYGIASVETVRFMSVSPDKLLYAKGSERNSGCCWK